jgi:hypothetical protein
MKILQSFLELSQRAGRILLRVPRLSDLVYYGIPKSTATTANDVFFFYSEYINSNK